MSKAYDRVNLAMLLHALNRLKIPCSFLKFVALLFSERFNQIFTAHGNTNLYPILSGIDQEEIVSPILWCIYYDPLCAIFKIHNLVTNSLQNGTLTSIPQQRPQFQQISLHSLTWMIHYGLVISKIN